MQTRPVFRHVEFLVEIRELLRQVPPGRVTTWQALALALGDARAVEALRELLLQHRPEGWHRVVGTDGRMPARGCGPLLLDEGVQLSGDRVRNSRSLLFEDFQSDHPLSRLRGEQLSGAESVALVDGVGEEGSVAGFDVTYHGDRAFAAAVVMDWAGKEVVEEVTATTTASFPYIPTYLAYREFEAISLCYDRLREVPSLLLVDGNGILHPARYGLASMVGVKLGRPTIGVAKGLLLGTVEFEPGPGEAAPVRVGDEVVGYCLRAGAGKPIYVSPGHLMSLTSALRLVGNLCHGRLPEPLRRAHLASRGLARTPGAY